MNKRILIAGGTGLIGSALKRQAQAKGYEVVVLSRHAGSKTIQWDPANGKIDIEAPQSFEAIINLAGSSISGGRWTASRQADIRKSRIDSCNTLLLYMQNGLLETETYIGASGVGYFRDSGEQEVDESSLTTQPEDWLVQTVIQWEEAHLQISTLGKRTIIFRFGIVLSRKGGALKEILDFAKFGVLAYFGHGRQFWPWIHVQDVAKMILTAVENKQMDGVYLATSPNPVRNKSFTKTINIFLKPRRIVMGVPTFVLRVRLGKMHSVLLDSCRANPKKLLDENFQFDFPELESAMKNLFDNT